MNRLEFTRLVEKHQKAVRRFLTALCCGDTVHADDLAQDSFLKAFVNCGELRDESKFVSWIFRIAYTTFVSSKRSIRPLTSIEEARDVCGPESADKSFEYQELYCCLEKLSEKERYAILLYYMQGYSINEIAGIMDASVDAVKKNLSRGRLHLKNFLEAS